MSHNRVAVTRLNRRLAWRPPHGPVDRPPPSQGGDLPQRVAAHGRRPAYHGTSQATGGNRSQRFPLVSAASAAPRFADDCRRLPPRGSIKAPSPRPVETALRGASSGSLSVSLGHLA